MPARAQQRLPLIGKSIPPSGPKSSTGSASPARVSDVEQRVTVAHRAGFGRPTGRRHRRVVDQGVDGRRRQERRQPRASGLLERRDQCAPRASRANAAPSPRVETLADRWKRDLPANARRRAPWLSPRARASGRDRRRERTVNRRRPRRRRSPSRRAVTATSARRIDAIVPSATVRAPSVSRTTSPDASATSRAHDARRLRRAGPRCPRASVSRCERSLPARDRRAPPRLLVVFGFDSPAPARRSPAIMWSRSANRMPRENRATVVGEGERDRRQADR